MNRVFADVDVCLDLLSGREPHHLKAQKLFSLAELGKIRIYVSALAFAHLDYILKSAYKRRDTRKLLMQFNTLVSVLPVEEQTVERALGSSFQDFEDALQYYVATAHRMEVILTRNLKDYSLSEIPVMDPSTYLKLSWPEM